mgnify:CR=1 FL=1
MDFNALLLRPSVLNLLRRIVPAPLRRLAWNLHWKHHLWKARRGVLLEPDVSRIIKRMPSPIPHSKRPALELLFSTNDSAGVCCSLYPSVSISDV